MEKTKNKTKSTYQMCGNKGRRNHGWIPRLDTFKGAEMLVSLPILAVFPAASSLNSDAFHYVPLCSMYSSRHATFVARQNKGAWYHDKGNAHVCFVKCLLLTFTFSTANFTLLFNIFILYINIVYKIVVYIQFQE